MNLNTYLNTINLNEDVGGTTSGAIGPSSPSHGTAGGPMNSGDVTFIPGSFKANSVLSKLSKKNKLLPMKVIKGANINRIKIGECNIDVRKDFWNDFKREIFEGKEPTDCLVDLSAYLAESLDTEVNIAMNKLKDRFTALLNEPVFLAQRKKIANIIKEATDPHTSFTKPEKTLISEPSVNSQIDYFMQVVNKAYKNNLGEIEILIHNITNRLPLNSLTLFRNLDNLSGNVLQGNFLGQAFVYYSVVTLTYELEEYLSFDNEDLTNRFKTHPGFKVVDRKIYPASEEGFETNLAETIKKFIQGAGQ